jgi:hypothetical protein
MTTQGDKEKELPIEERIGNLIGTIICLLLAAFFLWAIQPPLPHN